MRINLTVENNVYETLNVIARDYDVSVQELIRRFIRLGLLIDSNQTEDTEFFMKTNEETIKLLIAL